MNSSTFLICPNCKTRIPIITIKTLDGIISLRIQCECLKVYKEYPLEEFLFNMKPNKSINHQEENLCLPHSRQGDLYCGECLQWLCDECISLHKQQMHHSLFFDYEYNILCKKHKHNLIHLCNECYQSICSQCSEESHSSHKLLSMQSISDFDDIQIDKILKRTRETKELLIQIISSDTTLAYEDRIEKKEEIESLFQRNYYTNQLLRELIHLLLRTQLKISTHPNIALNHFLSSIELNTTVINLNNSDNVDKAYTAVKDYLTHSYIIQIKNKGENNIILSNKLNNDNNNEGITKTNESKQQNYGLKAHNKSIYCVINLQDNRIASGAGDLSIKIWDLTTFNTAGILKGHKGWILSLFLLKNRQLASGSGDHTIKLWNTTSFTCLNTITGHRGGINAILQLSPNILASCSGDQTIKFWDISSDPITLIETFKEHNDSILCMIQLENGDLVTGSDDATIKLWSLSQKKAYQTLVGHCHKVSAVVQLNNTELASGSFDNTLKIWDLLLNQCSANITFGGFFICAMIKLDHERIAASLSNNTIQILNRKHYSPYVNLMGHFKNVCGMAVINEHQLVSCSLDQTIKFWYI